MNATLQVLVNTPAFADYFDDCAPTFLELLRNESLTVPLSDLMQWIGSGRRLISPNQLHLKIQQTFIQFRGYHQHDSAEFLRCLLSHLHEELSKLAPPEKPKPKTKSPAKGKSLPDQPFEPQTIVSSAFGGLLESHVHCLSCGKDFYKDDECFDLPIQISNDGVEEATGTPQLPSRAGWVSRLFGSVGNYLGFFENPIPLEDCLSSFFKVELLTGEERYQCDHCKRLTDGEKQFRIKYAPEVLVIQLKRFRYDSYFSSKVRTPVIFPENELDLRPYMKHPSKQDLYDLTGIIVHLGSVSSGHYLAYVRSWVDDEWYEMNDDLIKSVSWEEVAQKEAYILIYRRQHRRLGFSLTALAPEEEIRVVPMEWYHRWYNFSRPGPIDYGRFLCEHQCTHPDLPDSCWSDMTVAVPLHVFEGWKKQFDVLPKGFKGRPTKKCKTCEVCHFFLMILGHFLIIGKQAAYGREEEERGGHHHGVRPKRGQQRLTMVPHSHGMAATMAYIQEWQSSAWPHFKPLFAGKGQARGTETEPCSRPALSGRQSACMALLIWYLRWRTGHHPPKPGHLR
jgi:hypothetical protein